MQAQYIATRLSAGYSVAMKSTSALPRRAPPSRSCPVTTPAQQPAPTTAFTGARVIDGTDRAPIDNATILVRDGRIVAVGAAPAVTDSGRRRSACRSPARP